MSNNSFFRNSQPSQDVLEDDKTQDNFNFIELNTQGSQLSQEFVEFPDTQNLNTQPQSQTQHTMKMSQSNTQNLSQIWKDGENDISDQKSIVESDISELSSKTAKLKFEENFDDEEIRDTEVKEKPKHACLYV